MDETNYTEKNMLGDVSLETEELLKRERFPILMTKKKSLRFSWAVIVHGASLLLSLSLFIAYLNLQFRTGECVREPKEVYKNITCFDNHFDYSYETKRFTDSTSSPYRQAGPRGEAAWNEIMHVDPFGVSLEVLQEIGAPMDTVKLTKKMGGGYMANLAVFHQLHCVKILWQYSHFDYYHAREPLFKEPEELIHQHLDHCADLVRQALMCRPDTTFITYTWQVKGELANATLSNPRTCRNYNEILEWGRQHAWTTVDFHHNMPEAKP